MIKPGKRRRARLVAAAAVIAALACCLPFTAASASQRPAKPVPGGWTRVFSDDFTGPAGSGLDSQWTYDQGIGYQGSGCPQHWGTGEVETATASASNVRLDGSGHVLIQPVDSAGAWTSGRIETVSSNFAAPAGGQMRVSATIQQPGPASGRGYWPAFWMLGAGFRAQGAGTSGTMACSGFPSIGEIDVMEDVNALSEVAGTLHCGTEPGGPCNESDGRSSGLRPCPGCQTGYHTYAVTIDRTRKSHESITWSLDGQAYFTVTERQVGTAAWQKAVDHGFFLILDLAIGGGFPNALCSCTTPTEDTTSGSAMSVDSVTVDTRAS